MQRVRETQAGLQMTQPGAEASIVTFSFRQPYGLKSYFGAVDHLNDEPTHNRLITVEGRDNIRDLGEWLGRLSTHPDAEEVEEVPFSFDEKETDTYTRTVLVAVARGEHRVEGLSSDLADAVDRSPSSLLGQMEELGLRAPDDMKPSWLLTQKYDKLALQTDGLFSRALPTEAGIQLGSMILSGLDTIPKKSIW